MGVSLSDADVQDVLPDSRLRESKGAVPGPGGYWVPVFCAMCGAPHGYVPEENCSFACWLCDPCAEQYGEVFGAMLMPDEVFWRKVAEEQLDKYGRLLTPQELRQVTEGSSPLSTMIREGA